MGDVEKCPFGATMVSTIGEEVTFTATARKLPSIPDNGNKSKVAGQFVACR